MSQRVVTVPVRVVRPEARQEAHDGLTAAQATGRPSVQELAPNGEPRATVADDMTRAQPIRDSVHDATSASRAARLSESQILEVDWRDRALRLQAEMDNYRKRQQRLAQDQIQTERRRLLLGFLEIVDDLERALAAPGGSDDELLQGIHITHRSALNLLDREGVKPLQAEGQAFDPLWHDAVATTEQDGVVAAPGTVVHVVETGYRLGDELLRPARVVVAA